MMLFQLHYISNDFLAKDVGNVITFNKFALFSVMADRGKTDRESQRK